MRIFLAFLTAITVLSTPVLSQSLGKKSGVTSAMFDLETSER